MGKVRKQHNQNASGCEQAFYTALIESSVIVTVMTMVGRPFHGRVVAFDKSAIILASNNKKTPFMLVYISDISQIYVRPDPKPRAKPESTITSEEQALADKMKEQLQRKKRSNLKAKLKIVPYIK